MRSSVGAVLFAVLLAVATGAEAAAAVAGEGNLLIMADDGDAASLRRDDPGLAAFVEALADRLGEAGWRMFDETAVTVGNFRQGRLRRSDAELVEIARMIPKPPVDTVVMAAVFARLQPAGPAMKLEVRAMAKVLDVCSGRRIATVERRPAEDWRLWPSCQGACAAAETARVAR